MSILITKKGYPEKSDILICTVTKIQYNSIFVKLEEFDRKQGIIHISEISPGRIRNVRDFVKEGKVIVCVVLRVNRDSDLIELSLRRVSDGVRRNKINEMKQEQKAAKLVEFVAKTCKIDYKDLLKKIISKVSEDYDTVHGFFEDFIMGESDLSILGLSDDVTKTLKETIEHRIKPPEVSIKGRFIIKSYNSDGIEVIKKALKKGKDIGKDKVTILYLGAGKYDLYLVDEDYKSAEKLLDKIVVAVEKIIKENKGEFSFSRTDK